MNQRAASIILKDKEEQTHVFLGRRMETYTEWAPSTAQPL